MTSTLLRITRCVIVIASLVQLAACSSNEASIDTLTKPIVATPTPTATVDPRITDLERIKVGMQAPDFSLADQNGKTTSLAEYRGKKNVVLVFYRTG